MTNTLSKDKTLVDFDPGVMARAGSPAILAAPARVVTELKPSRIEIPASAMELLFVSINGDGGYLYTPRLPPVLVGTLLITPLDKLRTALNRPALTAAQAHYSEVRGFVDLGGRMVLMPLEWSSAWVEDMRWVTTIIPATAGKPAVPPVAGQPALLTFDRHLGWNAGARSEQIIEPGTTREVKFTVGPAIGAAAGLARAASVSGQTRRSGYRHIVSGVLVSEGRVRMIRNGQIVRDAAGSEIEVVPFADVEPFSCVLIGGTCHWGHPSTGLFASHVLEERPGVQQESYVLDAMLYAADDYVDAPSITPVAMGAESAEGSVKLRPLDVLGQMSTPAGADGALRPLALRAGTAYADIEMRMPALACAGTVSGVGSAALSLRPVRAFASTNALGIADMQVRPLAVEIDVDGDYWLPSYAIAGLTMHPMALGAVVQGGGVMSGNLQTPPMWARLSESVYGEAVLRVESLQILGGLTAGTGPVDMVEHLLPTNSITERVYITIVISERMRARDNLGPQVLAVVSMMEQMEANDPSSVAQRALAFLLEQVGAMGPARALTFRMDGGDWALVDDSQGWAVNTETGGSSRYASFGYDSFATVNGRYLGVRANGVYLLEGDTDAGQPIHAGVHLGLQDFGTSQLKNLSNVYLGVSATGGLFIKVGVGQGDEKLEYTYAARRLDAHLATQRFDLGRGLRSTYFSFELVNDGVADFELEKIEFVAVASSRRI